MPDVPADRRGRPQGLMLAPPSKVDVTGVAEPFMGRAGERFRGTTPYATEGDPE